MKQNFTFHTHSVGFDGKNSPQEMINRAKELGFKAIGISNHFIVHPKIKQSPMFPYSVKGGYSNIYSESFDEVLARFIPHYEELDELRGKNPDIKILRGMEVDFFNNPWWIAGFNKAIEILSPDYIIGSAHFIEYNGVLLNSHDWKNCDVATQNKLMEIYWQNVGCAAQSGIFSWMAHLDLPKKVGLGREAKWAEHESRALESIAKSKTAIEINTSFYKPEHYEPYPSNRILQTVSEKCIPVIISDDAHAALQIGRYFEEASDLIKKFNLKTYER